MVQRGSAFSRSQSVLARGGVGQRSRAAVTGCARGLSDARRDEERQRQRSDSAMGRSACTRVPLHALQQAGRGGFAPHFFFENY